MPWEKAALEAQIGNVTPFKAVLNGTPLMLARVEGGLKCYSDTCMHRGGSLSQSTIDDGVVTCPMHFWQFSLADGRCLQVPTAQLKEYPVRLENGDVYVEV